MKSRIRSLICTRAARNADFCHMLEKATKDKQDFCLSQEPFLNHAPLAAFQLMQ